MYIYVKRQHRIIVPGLHAFVSEFTAEHAWGPEGYLVEKGLIPLLADDRQAERRASLAQLL